ncbi:TetR/AcrR family transcriptional regulator [Streptomyces sp. NBC_00237]|uniref:TetR/AcrR family transcriptional regulator n=1 Tax=Streptomyces sp. NBC_00237 TaxID=2975687 RepID=UPI00224E9751|nr:TetR/AcrR family transcriptional regulator [Streptomyces sp. NBC_00237]MCX5204073.1 TetR/AcrR family transcriptional regulator [Streptomyces sp. NBC_00237]
MSIEAEPVMGLRESKKHETRQLISDHATRLFIEKGFEATTIADVATASRVAKKTVTNYFARKEDMALDHQEEFVAGLARTVTGRAVGESALAALRREFLYGVERRDPVIGFAGERFCRMIADSPTLTARLRDLHDQREEALGRVLAEEAGAGVGDFTAYAVAAQLGSAQRVLFQRIMRLTLAGRSADEVADTVAADARQVFGLLEESFGGYGVK